MRIFGVLLFVFASFNGIGQAFEGEIIYQNSYTSKLPNVSDEKFAGLLGSKQEYFIKGARYKTIMNGSFVQWQIYVPAENRMYNKFSNNEAALWMDAGTNSDSVIRITLNKKSTEILGYACDELILICKSGTQKYYFSSKLQVDPKLFEKHNFGNWNIYVSNTRALALKIELDNPQFTLTSIAVEVKAGKLEDSVFAIPEGMKIEKSPY